MRFGVVLVHYHTPELAASAVAALRAGDAGDGAGEAGTGPNAHELDIVLVDNGSTDDGRRALHALEGVHVIDAGGNLGYAGGFNLGVRCFENADALVVMNPDVRVLPGCFQALAAALEAGAGVAGPRFWWNQPGWNQHGLNQHGLNQHGLNQPGGFQLPPTEQRGRGHSLRRFLAARSRTVSGRARRAWRRHARRHWLATETVPSLDLSGALLAIDADAWRQVGPFDDGYALYFEETDWLERARRAGVRGAYVPTAEAQHAYAQSTAQEGRSAQWFTESHRRFRRLHYGRTFTGALESASRFWPESENLSVPSSGPQLEKARPPAEIDWLEVAESPLGYPAAGRRLSSAEDPTEVLSELEPSPFWIRGLRGDQELFLLQPGQRAGGRVEESVNAP